MPNQGPAPLCDLVLEGGVTSALIYTGLIARLSRSYQFKRLGGTSGGAAAAAAGAIAQRLKLERLSGGTEGDPEEGFRALKRFPLDLAKIENGRTVLYRLFQPQPSTVRSYRIVQAYLRHMKPGHVGRALLFATSTLIRQFPFAMLLGAVPGLWMILLAARAVPIAAATDLWKAGPSFWLPAAVGFLLAIGLGLIVAAAFAIATTLRGLASNHLGLCNGMEGIARPNDKALTTQLHELYNKLLGFEPSDDPIIFKHLWGNGAEREIDLQVITTALGLRRPFRLPNEPGTDPLKSFFYDPAEWKDLFPPPVMRWLDQNKRLAAGPRIENEEGHELAALPPPGLLPVIVAVRLSLSFPGLLSAIPMYTIERSEPQPSEPQLKSTQVRVGVHEEPFQASKVYFSDGGITSNCPVHLFDAPLPGHPTFAVKLEQLEPEPDGLSRGRLSRVRLPLDDREALMSVHKASSKCALAMFTYFLGSIVEAARTWRDELQRALPGYRERVVIVRLRADEGGLNLAMTPRTIRRVAALGGRAATVLRHAYLGPGRDGRGEAWNHHRWIRLRTTLAAAQSYVAAFTLGAVSKESPYPGMLVSRPPIEPRWSDERAGVEAKTLLEGLSNLAPAPGEESIDLDSNGPQPLPRLHMSPPW